MDKEKLFAQIKGGLIVSCQPPLKNNGRGRMSSAVSCIVQFLYTSGHQKGREVHTSVTARRP